MHSQQPPGVVQNWSTLQCSKQNTEQCGYDHAPVTRGRMRAQFPLPHGPHIPIGVLRIAQHIDNLSSGTEIHGSHCPENTPKCTKKNPQNVSTASTASTI